MQNRQVPHFKTERLILKSISLDDVTSYTKHFVDYDVIRNLSNVVPWPYPENGVEEYITTMIFPRLGKTLWNWGIFLQSNPNELIGGIDLWKKGHPEHRGFWLGKAHWGNGYMTEAVYPINDFAFEHFGYDKLLFANAVGNTRSRRIKEKTGCSFVKTFEFNFVDPNLSESELWELTRENWEVYKTKHPKQYQIIPSHSEKV